MHDFLKKDAVGDFGRYCIHILVIHSGLPFDLVYTRKWKKGIDELLIYMHKMILPTPSCTLLEYSSDSGHDVRLLCNEIIDHIPKKYVKNDRTGIDIAYTK